MAMRFSPIKKRVALLPFYNEGLYGDNDLEIMATEEMRRELGRTREFVIDPIDAKIFGTSKEIFAGGGFKLSLKTQKAKLSGINFVVYGRISYSRIRQKKDEIGFIRKVKSFAEARLELRIFDVSSSKEIFNHSFTGIADDSDYHFFMSNPEEQLQYRRELLRYSVKVAVRKSVPQLLNIASKLDWVGRVAKILGTKVFVNAGRKSGLHIGDILKVLTEGSEVFDPETGALIGITKGEIKGTLEIVDYFGPDGSLAVLHSGGSISEGDFVQLY
ncbi:hypothetical protein OAB57_01500 [Bacteriovoracaceae bacterium]|nr:hypothetical protein [Bacteriovoracaceae bacterium]